VIGEDILEKYAKKIGVLSKKKRQISGFRWLLGST